MLKVIFDMDGVIFDSEQVCRRCWYDYAKQYGLKDVEGMFHECIGTTIEKTKEVTERYQGKDFPFEDFQKATSDRFHEIEAAEGLPVKEGARELLSWLKESGAVIGLASSTRTQTVVRQLTHAGMADFFDVIVGGEMAQKSKPEPDIYLETCRRLGIRPEGVYGIEDSYNGIRALSAAGLFPIMVPDILEPDEEMKSLAGAILDNLLDVRSFLKVRRMVEQDMDKEQELKLKRKNGTEDAH